MPSDKVTEILKPDELTKLLDENKFVVLDFHASWCPPCKAIAPLYEKLATEHAASGTLAFAKVNVDDVPEVAQKYSVSAMPTFMFFAAGHPAAVDAKVAASPALQMGPNGVDLIKGADPRSLTAVVKRLAELGNKTSSNAAAGKDGAADKADAAPAEAATVSGAYSLSSTRGARRGENKRADWRTSLQA